MNNVVKTGYKIRRMRDFLEYSNYGFSIIELVIALVIIGIIVAIAYPNIKDWLSNERVRSAAIQLAGHIKEARTDSIKLHREHCLCFDIVNDNYTVMDDNNNDGCSCTTDTVIYNVSIRNDFKGVDLTNGSKITFDARGFPVGLSSSTITLTNSKLSVNVRVTSLGRVEIGH